MGLSAPASISPASNGRRDLEVDTTHFDGGGGGGAVIQLEEEFEGRERPGGLLAGSGARGHGGSGSRLGMETGQHEQGQADRSHIYVGVAEVKRRLHL